MTAENRELVQLFLRASVLGDLGIKSLNAKDIPITVADAMVVIQTEANKTDKAIHTE